MADTCQANTLFSKFYSPGILATASSGKGENSYSVSAHAEKAQTVNLTQLPQHHSDSDLGVAVIDRYTHVILNFLEGINKTSTTTIQDMFNRYSFEDFRSNAGVRTDLYPRRPDSVRLTEFFGGVAETSAESISKPLRPPSVSSYDKPSTRLHQRDRKEVKQSQGRKTGPIAIPLPAIKPFYLQHSKSKEDALADERRTQSLHVETGIVIVLGHAICWVLWQCYRLGMFSSK